MNEPYVLRVTPVENGDYICDEAAETIIRFLQSNPSTTDIHCEGFFKPDPVFWEILAMLELNRAQLQQLRPSQPNQLVPEGQQIHPSTVQFLRIPQDLDNRTSEVWDFRGKYVDDAAAQVIAQAIRVNTSVHLIDLSQGRHDTVHGDIGPAGVQAIFHALQGNTTLRGLNLLGVPIDDAGGTALLDALQTNTTFLHLRLDPASMTPDLVQRINERLRSNLVAVRQELARQEQLAAEPPPPNTSPAAGVPVSVGQEAERQEQLATEPSPAAEPPARVPDAASSPETHGANFGFRVAGDAVAEGGGTRLPLGGLFAACGAVKPIRAALGKVAHLIPNFTVLLEFVTHKAPEVLRRLPRWDPDVARRFDTNLLSYLLFFTAEGYPKEQSVYYIMCRALREQERELVKPWVDYIWGLLHALKQLPPNDTPTLYRGFRGDWNGDLQAAYAPGRVVTWHSFASCSANVQVQEQFTGTAGDRVLFHLEMRSGIGRDLRHVSWYPDETEVLLPPQAAV
eukprot:EG_transcript_6557